MEDASILATSNSLLTSNLLLGADKPSVLPVEDVNMPIATQIPVKSDAAVPNMFPVAELSDLNNIDFQFLDEWFLPEHNQVSEIENMADFNSFPGNSFLETNIFPESLPENIDLNAILELDTEPSYHQTEAPDVNDSGFSVTSQSIYSDLLQSPSISVSELSSISKEENLNSRQDLLIPEGMICSSSDDSSLAFTILERAKSPTSGSDEASTKHKDDCLAGKKYLQMRQKNNLASQRSRKMRKQKNVEMVEELKKLEAENIELTQLVKDMEKEIDALQKLFMQIIKK